MNKYIAFFTYFTFQLFNSISAMNLLFFPHEYHKALFANPETAYAILGFSPTALDMLHNVLRGQGATLFAISIFLFILGIKERKGYLLITLICGFSLISHYVTLQLHLSSPVIRETIQGPGHVYGLLIINIFVIAGALYSYIKLGKHAFPQKR